MSELEELMSELYVLAPAADYRLFAGGQWVDSNQEHRCPVCGSLSGNTEQFGVAIALNHMGTRGFVELLWNSHSWPIFREDLIELWRMAGLKGFGTAPVHIAGWWEQPDKTLPEHIPSYNRLVVSSTVKLLEPVPVADACPRCGFVKYAFPKVGTHLTHGLQIDETTWDGADFCCLVSYVFVFCSRRAAEVTLDHGYSKHIAFVRAEDWGRWDEFDVSRWTAKEYHKYKESFYIRRSQNL